MFKKLLTLTLVVAMVATMLTGCGSNSAEKNGSNTEAGGEANKTLSIATPADAKSLDPHLTNDTPSANIMINMYENLMTLDEDGNPVGQLAEKWEKIDELSYKFYLKQGVLFHNGEEMKASDVKFSLLRAMNIEGSSVSHVVGDIDPEGFEIIDDYTIVIKLKRPFSVFLSYLTHVGGGSILCEKAVTEAGENYGENPIGTGPYKYKSWAKGDRIVLERYDGHRSVKPEYAEVVFRAIPEATSRTIELESGNVDIAYGIASIDVSRIEDNPNLKIERVINLGAQYLGFNCDKAPYNDVKVRQAISYALGVDQITKAVLRGVGTQATGPISPKAQYFNTDLSPKKKDLEKAKQLMKEAGFENGFKTTLWLSDKQIRIDMATIMQNQLKEIGIEVEVKVLKWSTFYEAAKAGETDMFLLGWTMSSPDPDMGLFGLFHSSMKGTNNLAFYESPEMDEMLEQGRVIENSDERKALYFKIQEELYNQAPWVYLYNGEEMIGLKTGVEGFTASPLKTHVIYNTFEK